MLIGGVRVFVSVAVEEKRQRLVPRESYEIASDPQLICGAHVRMHAFGPTWGCPRALPAALRGVTARDPGFERFDPMSGHLETGRFRRSDRHQPGG